MATAILPSRGEILQSLIMVAVPAGLRGAAVPFTQVVPVGKTS